MNLVVRNQHTRETDLCDVGDLVFERHSEVVYESRYGLDLGLVLGEVSPHRESEYRDRYTVIRGASRDDIDQWRSQQVEAHDAARVCAQRVEEHRLEMRIISGHYLLDRSKLLFFFVSDKRIDFRELVRDLSPRFRTRIELRQVGVRDETRIIGGIGICGRRVCCNGISDRLEPVSIRMAKDQNYSLNSSKVSGPCGRLLCCLAYEHRFYQEERRRFPREGALIDVNGETRRVQEINVVSGVVRVSGGDGAPATIPVCALVRRSASRGSDSSSGARVDWYVDACGCPATEAVLATNSETEDDIE